MLDDIHALLDALKLRHARAAVAEQIKAAQKNKTSYSAFLLELLRREHEGQRDRSIARRLKRSGLAEYWTLETFPFHVQKCVDKRLIDELAELDFVDRGQSLVFIGQPAVGKSGLAAGIMMKALYAGRRCQAIKADELFEELGNSHADRSTRRRLQRLARLDLLLIEEFGFISPLEPRQGNAFFPRLVDRGPPQSTVCGLYWWLVSAMFFCTSQNLLAAITLIGFSWPSMAPCSKPLYTSGKGSGVGLAPRALTHATLIGLGITRSLRPAMSSTLFSGRLLLVIWR